MEARQATRKREQKAARRHREEQQRKRQEQDKQEQEEQRRFAALSDREKVRPEVFPSTARLPERSDPFPGAQLSLLGYCLHHWGLVLNTTSPPLRELWLQSAD